MTIFVAALFILVLLGLNLSFLSQKVRRYFERKLLSNWRFVAAYVFFYPSALYLSFWLLGLSQINIYSFLTFQLYLLIPTVLVYLGSRQYLYDTLNILDLMAITIIWLGVDTRIVFDAWKFGDLRYIFTITSGVWLVLCLFLGVRRITGMKYNLRITKKDVVLTLSAFMCFAVLAISMCYSIGFINNFQPSFNLKTLLWSFGILFFTELLFRGLIQNGIEKILKEKWSSLIIAAIIFGAAHLNNGAVGTHVWEWNWKYFIMASLAGLFYGHVFQKTKSIFCPVVFHATVDITWHALFK